MLPFQVLTFDGLRVTAKAGAILCFIMSAPGCGQLSSLCDYSAECKYALWSASNACCPVSLIN